MRELDDPRVEAALARAAGSGDVGLHVEEEEVEDPDARALELYREAGLAGLLIYVSIGSRQVRILDADHRDFSDLAAIIARGFASGDPVGGLVAALERLATADPGRPL